MVPEFDGEAPVFQLIFVIHVGQSNGSVQPEQCSFETAHLNGEMSIALAVQNHRRQNITNLLLRDLPEIGVQFALVTDAALTLCLALDERVWHEDHPSFLSRGRERIQKQLLSLHRLDHYWRRPSARHGYLHALAVWVLDSRAHRFCCLRKCMALYFSSPLFPPLNHECADQAHLYQVL